MTQFMLTIGLASALLAFGPNGVAAAAQEPDAATKVQTSQEANGDQPSVPFPARLPGKGTPAHTVASGTRSVRHLMVTPETDTTGATSDAKDVPPLSRATAR